MPTGAIVGSDTFSYFRHPGMLKLLIGTMEFQTACLRRRCVDGPTFHGALFGTRTN